MTPGAQSGCPQIICICSVEDGHNYLYRNRTAGSLESCSVVMKSKQSSGRDFLFDRQRSLYEAKMQLQ